MSHSSQKRDRNRWRAVVRAVAVLILLMAAADMTFPEICRENKSSIPAASSSSAILTAQTDDDSSDQTQREDCFCCCSHIVSAEPQTLLTSLPATTTPLPGRALGSPSVPVQSFFRPPRLA